MAKLTTLGETVDYIHNYMTKHDLSGEVVEKDVLYDMMEEELLDAVEDLLKEEDMKDWFHDKDNTHLDKILNERMEDYPGLLESIKNDILVAYIKED